MTGVPTSPSCVRCDAVDPADLWAAVEVARRRGAAGCEIYLEHRDSLTLRGDDRAVEARTDRDVGASVRVGLGEPVAYAATNVVTRAGLAAAAEAAVAAAGSGGSGSSEPGPAADRRMTAAPHSRVAPHDRAASKADLVRRAAQAARSVDPRVRSALVTLVQVSQHLTVVTVEGKLVRDVRSRTRMTCRVVARDGSGTQAGFAGPGLGGGLELFARHPPEEIGRAAAERAVRRLTGVDMPSGVTTVVLGPAAGGLFLHEACGHGLEADGLWRGTSAYARTAGHRLAASMVTALDDPRLEAGFGSYTVDDEGVPAVATVLLDQGVQTGALTLRAAAGRVDVPQSANGRRESYAHPPLCRMSNTFIQPGTDGAADILADVAHGVYVATLGGGDVDVTTGDFAFTASDGRLVEHGRLTHPVAGATLLGNGPQALAAIDAVGDDLEHTPAMCGKDGQWVPVSYGSPTIRLTGLTVTGR